MRLAGNVTGYALMGKFLLSFLLLLFFASSSFPSCREPRYAVATLPTPVLNTPDFAGVFGGPDGMSLRTDASGLIRALEFVALPGTPFLIEAVIRQKQGTVYRVATEDYPSPSRTGYFIDSRFVTASDTKPPARRRVLPALTDIIARLLAARGSAYVWGGNLRSGIPEMLSFFSPSSGVLLDSRTSDLWQLRGVDCSGLLYEATGGYTPRNTSSLVTYGTAVPIAGLRAADIVRRLEPLDLIVWSGHVLVVLDRQRVIESHLGGNGSSEGVRVSPLQTRLEEIMSYRTPADVSGPATAGRVFVIRRWYARAVSALR
jgi:cell wall-associated NlpC family hydrolase